MSSEKTQPQTNRQVCSCFTGHPVSSAELLFLHADWYHYGAQSGSVDATHTKHTRQVKAERTAAALSALGATKGTQEGREKSSRRLISMQRESERKLAATVLISTFWFVWVLTRIREIQPDPCLASVHTDYYHIIETTRAVYWQEYVISITVQGIRFNI